MTKEPFFVCAPFRTSSFEFSSSFFLPSSERSRRIRCAAEGNATDVSTSLDMTKRQKAYARAGVDVDLGNKLKRRIQSLVSKTHGVEVLGKIGGFGGLFAPNFRGMREPVLVASVDGVGTKLKIAFAAEQA